MVGRKRMTRIARKSSALLAMLAMLAMLSLCPAASAQEFPLDPYVPAAPARPVDQGSGLRDVGRTADAGAGEIGQRQSRDQAAPTVDSLGRVAGRIENRIENRIRNRIDRYYNPAANSTSPFEQAEDRLRRASVPRGR